MASVHYMPTKTARHTLFCMHDRLTHKGDYEPGSRDGGAPECVRGGERGRGATREDRGVSRRAATGADTSPPCTLVINHV